MMRSTTCSDQSLRPLERDRHFNQVRRRIASRRPRLVKLELMACLSECETQTVREMVRHEFNRSFAHARKLMEVPA